MLLLSLVTGCATGAQYPGYIQCDGKGTITGGGFALTVDCTKLRLEQGATAPASGPAK